MHLSNKFGYVLFDENLIMYMKIVQIDLFLRQKIKH